MSTYIIPITNRKHLQRTQNTILRSILNTQFGNLSPSQLIYSYIFKGINKIFICKIKTAMEYCGFRTVTLILMECANNSYTGKIYI